MRLRLYQGPGSTTSTLQYRLLRVLTPGHTLLPLPGPQQLYLDSNWMNTFSWQD